MAKEFESDFYAQLQNSVVKDEPVVKGGSDKLDDLISKLEQKKRTLEELESNVIVDPKAVKSLKKEIKDLEKAIEDGKLESTDEAEIETDEEVKEQEEKEAEEEKKEVEEEEQSLKREEEELVTKERSEVLKEEYYNALVELYNQRIANINLAKHEGKLITSRGAFDREVAMEKEMFRLREEYMAMGYEDPFKSKRTELIAKEKEAKEPIELQLREKSRKFREYEQELERMDREETEINDELMDPDISSARMEELNKRLEELGADRKKVELDLTTIRKDLEPAIDERTRRTVVRAGLETQHFETLTKEDKANYSYQKQKVLTMNYNTERALTQEYRNLQLRIEEREHHLKMLDRELKKTPATDFERRLELLGKMDKETAMLEADRESKSDMDLGLKPTDSQRKMDILENYEIEEDRQEDFERDTEEVRAIIEEQDKMMGRDAVATPVESAVEEQNRSSDAKAAMAAVLIDNPHKPGPDTIVDDVKQGLVAKCVIEGLEDKVRDPEVPEDALAMVANDEAIEKANEELQRKEEELADKMV